MAHAAMPRSAGNLLGSLVEKSYAPVSVYGKNAVGYAIKDNFGLGREMGFRVAPGSRLV